MSLPVIREPLASSPALPPLSRPASSIFDIPIDLGPPVELLATVARWAEEGGRDG